MGRMMGPVVDVRDVGVQFGSLTALRGVDLQINEGEMVGLLGPSGAGKSTLLRCLNRLVAPTVGDGTVLGLGLSAPEAEWRTARRRIGFIFQDYGTVDRLSAFRNVVAGRLGTGGIPVALGFPSRREREAALTALETVGLRDRARSTVRTLSGGMRQRVAIARVLCQDPALVLADEPVSNLDPALARQVLTLLRNATVDRGVTCVTTYHHPDLARRFSDRIIALRDGEVILDGNPDDFDDGAANDLYGFDTQQRATGVDSRDRQAAEPRSRVASSRVTIP
jgi:phosphonate transport system ATP-binding protein